MDLATLAATTIAILLGVATAAIPAIAIEEGMPAPAFSAKTIDGRTVSLAEHRGKVVYLDFWASWCGPCAEALPALDALRREFPEEDFQVIAVNVDSEPKKVRAFLERRPVGYPSAFDPRGEIPTRFGVETMPTSFLIDRRGVVRHVHTGFSPYDVEMLRERIQALVASGR